MSANRPTKPGFYWFRHYREFSDGEEVHQCLWECVEVCHFDNMNPPGLYCSDRGMWTGLPDKESGGGEWFGECFPPTDAPEAKFINDWTKGTVPL